jgi:hypothetical protein
LRALSAIVFRDQGLTLHSKPHEISQVAAVHTELPHVFTVMVNTAYFLPRFTDYAQFSS